MPIARANRLLCLPHIQSTFNGTPMPELPEVETIARVLRQGGPKTQSLLGKRITNVRLLWDRTLATPSPAEFEARLTGHIFQAISRRGKFLITHLSQGDKLVFHLRMSGDLLLQPDEGAPAPHDRLILGLHDGQRLTFNDARKFGRVWLVSDLQAITQHLGPEPLESSFTPNVLFERLHSYRRQIKPLLMDQSFLAGLGNIYADEALHMAGIHPLRSSDSLDYPEAERLWRSIRQVLQDGIRLSGASIDWVYRGGEFQNQFRVYQRAGEACLVCQTPIRRIVVGQRGTHYCPVCQADPSEMGQDFSGRAL
jgi:formamidopyrimidine-DNA glycosylase